jgi:hypothetical protein
MEASTNSLIGTKHLPPHFAYVRGEARRAKAYYNLKPYPIYGFQRWKTEASGPLPRCRPFVQRIAKMGAEWLFGKPVQFKAEKHDDLSKFINDTWNANRMGSKALDLARKASLIGGFVLKFSYDETQSPFPRITALEQAEQTRLYFDAHDTEKLVMARIQYAVMDPTDGEWYWHREDWSDDEYVVYDRIKVESATGLSQSASINPYDYSETADKSEWTVQKRETNEFGIIPVWLVRNRLSGDWYGCGDLWDLYDAVDQINFTRDLGHKDNQKRVNPKTAYIDLDVPENESAAENSAGGAVALESTGDSRSGRVELLEPRGNARADIDQFARDLQRELFDAAGITDLSPEAVTGKGAMTAAVIRMIFDSTIRTTEEKRRLYGEDGFCMFFERMLIGLTNLGVLSAPKDIDVQCLWPSLISLTPEDLRAMTETYANMVKQGFTTQERAIRAIAAATDVNDSDVLLDEVANEREATQAQKAKESAEEPTNGSGDGEDN